MVKYLSLILVVICAGGLFQGAVGRVVRRSYDQGLSADQPIASSNYGGDVIKSFHEEPKVLPMIKDLPSSNYGGDKSIHFETKVEDQPRDSGYSKRGYGSDEPKVLPMIKDLPSSNYGGDVIRTFHEEPKVLPSSNYGGDDKIIHFETKVEDQPHLSGYSKRDTYGADEPKVLPMIKDLPSSNYGGDETKAIHFETKVEDQPRDSGYSKRGYGSDEPKVLPLIKDLPSSNYGGNVIKSFHEEPKVLPSSNYGGDDKIIHFETKVADQPRASGYSKRGYGGDEPKVLPLIKDVPAPNYGSVDKSFRLVTKVEDQSQY